MAASGGHGDHVPRGHPVFHAVHNGLSLAGDHHPDLVPVGVAVVMHAVPGVEGDLDGHALRLHIQHPEGAPALLGKHDLLVHGIYKGLDVAGLLFIGNQNAVGRSGNHHIVKAHGQHRHVRLIDDVHAFAGLIHHALADDPFFHRLCQGVPGAQVHPPALEAHDLDIGLMLHHGIVEGDLLQGLVLMEQVLIVCKIDELMGPVQHIAELIGKDAAVPQSSPGDILSRHCRRGLFLEGIHPGDGLGGLRDDVAVFFTGIGGLDAHKHQIGLSLVRLGAKALQRLKVVVIHIGVHRAHHHGFILGHTHHVHQIGSGQGDGREGVPPAGL